MPAQVVNLTDTFDQWRVKTNTVATLAFTALQNVIDDATPELGGDLDVLTRSIVSSSNRNIAITPHGTGLAVITKGSYSGKLGADLDLNSNDITGTGSFAGTSIAGTVAGTTQAAGNNTTLLATTAFVKTAVEGEDTLAEMNDTTISAVGNLEILQYTGSAWENQTLAEAGIPTKGFTVAMAVALG